MAQEAVFRGIAGQGEVTWLEAPNQFSGYVSHPHHPGHAGRCPGQSKMREKSDHGRAKPSPINTSCMAIKAPASSTQADSRKVV